MNKYYIFVPLVCTLIFGGIYYKFDRDFAVKQARVKQATEDARKEKLRLEMVDREKAMAAAVEAAKVREVERQAKAAVEEAKKTARLEAEDYRERTYADRNKFREQVGRLKKEQDEARDSLKKVEEEKKHNLDEQAFLRTYVKQAEANVKYYYDLLDKIAAAEKARIEAEAAAAAAAAKKS